MADSDQHEKQWRELYQAALIEHDPAKLKSLITEAHKAIQRETRRLWYARSLNTHERQSLDAASHYLEMLYSFANMDNDRRNIA